MGFQNLLVVVVLILNSCGGVLEDLQVATKRFLERNA